jgi:hypothetical protein
MGFDNDLIVIGIDTDACTFFTLLSSNCRWHATQQERQT